jgi:hypothetical protein
MKSVDIVDWHGQRDDIIPMLVEIQLPDPKEDSFLKIRETLTRIGIASKFEDKVLFQTCHILQKRSRYYILHFKTLFVLDGRDNNLTRGDIARQNKIISLLEEWGLCAIVDPSMIDDPMAGLGNTMIVPYNQKSQWVLKAKYKLGNN